MLDLQALEKRIASRGADMVMVSDRVLTTKSAAWSLHGIRAEVVFIRNDGWTLGVTKDLAGSAYGLYPSLWEAWLELPTCRARPIIKYLAVDPAAARDYLWRREVMIECPECETVFKAEEIFYRCDPFPSYGAECTACGYMITESEWLVVKVLGENPETKGGK